MTIFVDNITVWINKISLRIYSSALIIDKITLSISIQYRYSKWIHFKITHHILNIEFSERENLWNLIVFKMFLFKDLSSVFINHISKFINKITSAVDSSARIVNQLSFGIGHWGQISISVFVNRTNHISYIKSSAIIVEKLWEVTILCKLRLVKLFTSLVVNDISVFIKSVTTSCYFSTSSINESIRTNMDKDWVTVAIKIKFIGKRNSVFINPSAFFILFNNRFTCFVEVEVTLKFSASFVDVMACVSCS